MKRAVAASETRHWKLTVADAPANVETPQRNARVFSAKTPPRVTRAAPPASVMHGGGKLEV